MDKTVHLIKLCVGAEKVEDLLHWQQQNRAKNAEGLPVHVTRMWPKREAEILNGGSLYWVFKGVVLARQPILRLDEVTGADGIRRCAIVLDPSVTRTEAAPKRPFQGWRYLPVSDAPADLRSQSRREEALPAKLEMALAEIGVR
ncbi:DUF1489 family protein [Tropicimonas sp. S265A]|uniref:DUF1489 family protein n=1 Tax=Tropicimonas sp. S265A TaxID=3415134 RepID=UPI003C7CC2F6